MFIRRSNGEVWGHVLVGDGVVVVEPLDAAGAISIHATGDGAAVLVSTGDSGARLLISVADNGEGFVAEMDGERSRRAFQIEVGGSEGNAS